MERLLQLARYFTITVVPYSHIFGAYEPLACCIRSMLMNILSQCAQVMAVDLSHRLGWIDDSIVKRVHVILKQANLPTAPPANMTVDMFKSVMAVRDWCSFFFNVKNNYSL